MKKVALLLSALLFLGCAAFGQALTQADRERSVKYLQQTRDGVVAATKGLSEAQMKFKPAPDRWSVAETLEHIALAEDFLLQNISEKIMMPSSDSTDAHAKVIPNRAPTAGAVTSSPMSTNPPIAVRMPRATSSSRPGSIISTSVAPTSRRQVTAPERPTLPLGKTAR